MLKKAVVLVLAGASIASWTACGKTTSHYVYAALPGSSQIAVYREDPNSGVLTALSGSPFPSGAGPQSIAIHPSGKFLYAANGAQGENDVSLFNIANAGSNNVSAFSVSSSNGALTPVQGSPFPVGLSALDMKLNPAGTVLYLTGS